jgi:hypothetical protein
VGVSRTRFSTRGPKARRGTVISFRLGKPGKVLLVVRSAAACEVVGRRRVAGVKGMNRVRFLGRVHGRPLAPGRYTIDVVVVRGTSRKRIGRVGIEVVQPGRRLTKAQRVSPVAACTAPAPSPSLPAAVVTARRVDRGGAGGNDPKPAGQSSHGGVLGAVFQPPKLPPFGGGDEATGGGLAWLGLGVYALLVGAFLTMLLYVARFLRGSWNP